MPTVTLRPSKDVASAGSYTTWPCSSGSVNYAMVNESVADDDATYIYTKFSSTSAKSMRGRMEMAVVDAPSSEIKIKSVRPVIRARVTNQTRSDYAKISGAFAMTVNGATHSFAMDDHELTSTNYVDIGETKDAIDVGAVVLSEVSPAFVVTCSGGKGSSKNDDFEIRVTQVYVEIEYETSSPPATGTGIYLKRAGAQVQAAAVWRKENGLWVKADKTAIDAGKNYRIIQR